MSAAREWFSAAELAKMGLSGMPAIKAGVQQLVHREGWMGAEGKTRKRRGHGGGIEFHQSLVEDYLLRAANDAARECARSLARLYSWSPFHDA